MTAKLKEERFSSIEIETSDYFQIAICDKEQTMIICNIHFEHEKKYQRHIASEIVAGLNLIERNKTTLK